MSLNNAQYDSIMRDYQLLQTRHRHELDERIKDAFSKLPRLQEIDAEIASKSIACGRKLLSGDDNALSLLREEISELGAERYRVLKNGGFPENHLQMQYTCSYCQDTGYIGNEKCRCFRKAEIDLLYTQSNLQQVLDQENFGVLSYDYHSPQFMNPSGKISSLDAFRKAVELSKDFVYNFDSSFVNLFFFGDTGVGKTFLSHCIAKELLDSIHSVIYFSSQELFEQLAEERFNRDTVLSDTSSLIYNCDLLIIDDLGTEMTNSFVISELFTCLNERLNKQKSTIISTNLSLESLRSTYSERISSRIYNGYTMIKLFGEDIRLQKKLRGLSIQKSDSNNL